VRLTRIMTALWPLKNTSRCLTRFHGAEMANYDPRGGNRGWILAGWFSREAVAGEMERH